MLWENAVEEKYKQMIDKIPPFLRPIAQTKVSQRIEKILKEASRQEATEKDLVDAFFAETPFGFHGPMKTDMRTLGIDYTRYGYNE